MRSRQLLAFTIAVFLATPTAARAAEDGPGSTTSDIPAWSVGATLAVAQVHYRDATDRNPYRDGGGFQLAASRRLGTNVSIGGVSSFAPWIERRRQLWRASGEARAYLVPVRFVELWVAGELGFAVVHRVEHPNGVEDSAGAPAASPEPATPTRFGPLFGAGVGIDLVPFKPFAFGVEGRALRTILGPEIDHLFTLGFTLTGRFG